MNVILTTGKVIAQLTLLSDQLAKKFRFLEERNRKAAVLAAQDVTWTRVNVRQKL